MSINGIDVKWSGEVRPIADHFVASASGVIAGVTVDRIRRFTGPLGFSRRQGELGARMEVQFSVDSMKSWRLGTKGRLTLESVELATDDGLNAAMVSTTVDLYTEATFSPEQGFTVSGFIGGEAKGFGLSDGPRDAIGVEGASFALSEFAVTRFGSFSVAPPTADSAGDTRIPSLARQLVNWIEAIALEFVNGDLDGNITGMLAANGIQISKEQKEVKLGPKNCLRCKTINPMTNRYCRLCGFVIDDMEVQKIVKKEAENEDMSIADQ